MSADNHNDPLTLNRLAAAIATLKQLGYTYHGGEQWKPPIGKKPDFDQIDQLVTERDALRAENERLFTAVNDWIYANGPNGWIDALRADVEVLKYQIRIAVSALADICVSSDMTLDMARRKAQRILAAIDAAGLCDRPRLGVQN